MATNQAETPAGMVLVSSALGLSYVLPIFRL